METTRNKFRNNTKMVDIGTSFWDASEQHGMAGIVGELKDNRLTTPDGHVFTNFSCCSYLDLDQHPKIIEGAVTALRRYGVLDHCITRARVQLPALLELEDSLAELFSAQVTSAISASVASSGVLPLVASGHLTGGRRPVMIFDKNVHVSMHYVKPVCADETEVLTSRHHDLDFIEDACRKNDTVCYVCDGADSLGGYAPVLELRALQERYSNLHVYYDDCHSISAYGKRGVGYVRSHIDEIDERTIIIATLNKAFGASGAAILLGNRSKEELRIIERFGGAIGYSQPMNTAAVGACLASAEIHRTDELTDLQAKLQDNIRLFDSLVHTAQAGSSFPIRLVPVNDAEVIDLGKEVYQAGFYVSPVFFPVVARGTAGLRVMMRAGQTTDEIRRLAGVINNALARTAQLQAVEA
ncbi:aminotransferase class I and II [Stenotrophomonas maltophilia]|uniref:8-amino-7-oxononanoate synthase family protein n=1 Tax=Stenotrophomonas maltophilia TaxID=40324 RepID=UPI00066B9F4E|nr:aminotransferase class I and II [Stenotrophomonas maltophilia]